MELLESFYLLEKENFPLVDWRLINNELELKQFLDKHKRIVLKVSNPQIIHKTEEKAVYTNIIEFSQAKEIWEELIKRGKVIAQKHVDGIELIIGVKEDKTFGKIIMFGLGGIFVEIFRDVSFRMIPLNREEIKSMINELKFSQVFYKRKKYLLDSLIDLIYKTSQLALKYNIKELDFNPVILNEEGTFIVDARIF